MVFYNSSGIYGCFQPKVLSETPKTALFTRGPIPEVLVMRWEKVLTSETPCNLFWELNLATTPTNTPTRHTTTTRTNHTLTTDQPHTIHNPQFNV